MKVSTGFPLSEKLFSPRISTHEALMKRQAVLGASISELLSSSPLVENLCYDCHFTDEKSEGYEVKFSVRTKT